MTEGLTPPPEEHPDPERVAALADGRLTAAEAGDLEAHLASCPRCFRDYADVVATLALHARGIEDEPRPRPIPPSPRPWPARWALPHRWRGAILAGGAAAALAVGYGAVERHQAWERGIGPIRAAVGEASGFGLVYPDVTPATPAPGPPTRSGNGHLTREFREALNTLDARAGSDPDPRQAYWLGAGLTVSGDLPSARLIVDGARRGSPDDSRLAMLDAILAAAEGNPERSETILEGILRDHPGDPLAERNLQILRETLGTP